MYVDMCTHVCSYESCTEVILNEFVRWRGLHKCLQRFLWYWLQVSVGIDAFLQGGSVTRI